MVNRVLLALGALLLAASALVGVRFSGATWTDESSAPVAVSAARDWTPPTVGITSTIPAGVYGTSVTVAARASDSLSAIGSLTISYSVDGGATWTALTGCATNGTNPRTTSCPWNTTTVSDGDYQLRATAADTEGNVATSSAVSTSVTNNGQAVLEPVADAVRGVVTVVGHLSNAGSGGTKLDLYYKSSSSSDWIPLSSTSACSGHDNPIACTWDTGALADGSYDVRLTASIGLSDLQTGIIVDNHKPTAVTLTVPAGTLSGTQTLTATASDSPAGLGSMTFQYQLAGDTSWTACAPPDTTAPYSCDLYTTTLTSGSLYSFRVTATDRAGNEEFSSTVQRRVDNSPASVSLTNPLTGSVLDGTVPVTADAHAPSGATSVDLQYRRVGAGSFTTICTATASPYSCPWSTTALTNGNYELRAVLTPGYGPVVTSTTQTVSVDHSVGTVTITSPGTGATFGPNDPTTVTVTGSTSSTQGVSAVVLKATATSPAGAVTSTPCSLGAGTFTCTWDNATIVYGELDLRAEMTQGNGVVVTSASPVHVTVNHVTASMAMGVAPAPYSAPANYVAGTETFTASVTSNLAVSKVAFSYRSSPSGAYQPLCQADTTAPYTCVWDTTPMSGIQPLFPNGAYDVQALMTLSNGDTRTATTSVNVQNLRAVDVQGVISPDLSLQSDEALTFTYSTRVLPGSLVTGWSGAGSAAVPVTFARNKPGGGAGATLTAGNLGQVVFDEDYVKNGNAYTGTAHVSLDPNDEKKIILTFDDNKLGSSFHQAPGGGVMLWTPTTAVTGYYAHGSCSAADVSETGTFDAEF